MERVYLDVCCLNRPFDDQEQDRIRVETETIRLILKHIKQRELIWVGSFVVNLEIERTKSDERREQMLMLMPYISEKVKGSESDLIKAEDLEKLGFGAMDALHLILAEKGKADVFLTTDDKLLKKAKKHSDLFQMKIINPLDWV